MILSGGLFWFLMGAIFVLVAIACVAFARDRGWTITWWKGLLAILWYAILSLSFFAWGTLIGEGESGAGFKIFLIGLFITIVLGVALLRLFPRPSR